MPHDTYYVFDFSCVLLYYLISVASTHFNCPNHVVLAKFHLNKQELFVTSSYPVNVKRFVRTVYCTHSPVSILPCVCCRSPCCVSPRCPICQYSSEHLSPSTKYSPRHAFPLIKNYPAIILKYHQCHLWFSLSYLCTSSMCLICLERTKLVALLNDLLSTFENVVLCSCSGSA